MKPGASPVIFSRLLQTSMSIEAPYVVAIVVDPAYGPHLLRLSARMHVWAVDTPLNRAVAEQIWSQSPGFDFEAGVTLFRSSGKGAIQDVADIIGVVDTHHGESSHVPAVSVLEVYGADAPPELRTVFARYGFTHLIDIDGGFRAISRPAASYVAASVKPMSKE